MPLVVVQRLFYRQLIAVITFVHIDGQLDVSFDFYIYEMYYQVHMYVDSREKVTARYQVISAMNYSVNIRCFMMFYHFH